MDLKEMEKEVLSSIYKVTKQIKKHPEKSLFDRLRSIVYDKEFLQEHRNSYPSNFPLIANLRCGLWYFPKFDSTCYFKSTDGHIGQWKFSLSRLNLNVAEAAAKSGGVLIVDSTRKGKRYPDSFTRTIPIWACTLNRAVKKLRNIGDDSSWDVELRMPAGTSLSEISQIEGKIDGFVTELLSSGADLRNLVDNLRKPLRTLWVSASSVSWDDETPDYEVMSFYPIMCISVSKNISEESNGVHMIDSGKVEYIQGAGDDEESWSRGLTPSMFWNNLNFIMKGAVGIQKRVDEVVDRSQQYSEDSSFSEDDRLIVYEIGNSRISIGTSRIGSPSEMFEKFDAVLNCSSVEYEGFSSEEMYLHAPVKDGKSDKHKLCKVLPVAIEFIMSKLETGKRVLIHSYKDITVPVCICLATLVQHFDFEGSLLPSPRTMFSKDIIRRQFLYLEKFCPQCRPPRFMMNELNRYFMSPKELQPKSLSQKQNDKPMNHIA